MFLGYKYFKGIYNAIFITFLIICSGTIGYRIIEGWTWLESFYMTMITVTTVGFMEVQPLSDAGRIFTAVLIVTSFGTIAYAVSVITSYIAGGDLKRNRKELLIEKAITKMEKQVIVCGYGRVGKQAADELMSMGTTVVVIERTKIHDKDIPKGLTLIQGDATHDDILHKAGIDKASSLIAALPADTDNLFVVLTAHEINPSLKIISRSSERSTVKKLKVAGADYVIMPDTVGGTHMASLVVNPDLIEFLNLIRVTGNSSVNLEQIRFDQLSPDFESCSIKELEEKSRSGCNVIGYKSASGEYQINPDLSTVIEKGSKLFVLGNAEQIRKLNSTLGI